MRIGIGYDVHPLKEGRKLILGGVEIPYSKGLDGHSDADVLLHAIIDALLGAMGANDIGYFFPSSDSSLRGVSSLKLLEKVTNMVESKGFRILNIDSIIIAEKPELSKYYQKMKGKICSVLHMAEEFMSIKGKRMEGLGFEGKGEGMTAMATALLEKEE